MNWKLCLRFESTIYKRDKGNNIKTKKFQWLTQYWLIYTQQQNFYYDWIKCTKIVNVHKSPLRSLSHRRRNLQFLKKNLSYWLSPTETLTIESFSFSFTISFPCTDMWDLIYWSKIQIIRLITPKSKWKSKSILWLAILIISTKDQFRWDVPTSNISNPDLSSLFR